MSDALPSNAGMFLARLARLGAGPEATAVSALPEAPLAQDALTALTPAMLRTALLELGVSVSAENLQLAEAFTQLGLPLTRATVTEAHVGLAAAPEAVPLSFALAKSLDLPPTPDILRALSVVTTGIPARRALPMEITQWLGLAIQAEEDADTLAGHLHLLVNQRAVSTERCLAATGGAGGGSMHDTRSLLLRLAQAAGDRQVRTGADALAAHIEGQQLINLVAQRSRVDDQQAALYFALPLLLPGEQSTLELSAWRRDEGQDKDWDEEAPSWHTSLRLTTVRLGRIEAALSGTTFGRLTCHLGAEQAATTRLLLRSREKLTASLAAAGWPTSDVTCHSKTDWPPLWHGGEALTAPRTCVDWKA